MYAPVIQQYIMSYPVSRDRCVPTMIRSADPLTPQAQQLLECLTTTRHQQQLVAAHSWVAYLDRLGSTTTFAPRNAVVVAYQLNYRAGLRVLMELIQARKICIDEVNERAWQFHLTTAENCQFQTFLAPYSQY